MAIMIPKKPDTFTPNSMEDVMFEALTQLPDDYYVFYSLKIISVDDYLHESETDFVILNRTKGIMCIEAKAGKIMYKDGEWRYGNGIKMHNGGPFNQASANKWKLIEYIRNSNQKTLLNRCKVLHAVWFPSINDISIQNIVFPPEADKQLVINETALGDPLTAIDKIFNIKLSNGITTSLSVQDVNRLIENVLCPMFDITPTATLDKDLKKVVFHRMLKEQVNILKYLSEQRAAVINGVAGTGKTMIAVEKAKHHAANGEHVLFLCYNNQLKEYLKKTFYNERIDYYTIDGLACKFCNTEVADYIELKTRLEDIYISGGFRYNHVIIDEGQDFGQYKIEESEVIQLLKDIIIDGPCKEGSFYVFYDKLQLIQGKEIPAYIDDADCKLTLYKNCRNTENIAKTSMRPITDKMPKLFEGCIKGTPARMHFCSSVALIKREIDNIINSLELEGINDIAILTCRTIEKSVINNFCEEELYNRKIKISTCRKFKGLEADSVIIIDVDEDTFNNDILLYYVGASRARLKLDIVTEMDKHQCKNVMKSIFHKENNIQKPQRDLSLMLNAICEIKNE